MSQCRLVKNYCDVPGVSFVERDTGDTADTGDTTDIAEDTMII